MNVVARLGGRRYLAPQYAEMHAAESFAGVTWRERIDEFLGAVPEAEELSILDFGCGPRGGLAESFGDRVIPFDPYVEEYAEPPWSKDFDVVFSSDVLEHLSRPEIDDFVSHVRASGAEHVYLVVATRPAAKHLPGGANAHVTVKPADWWDGYLSTRLAPSFMRVSADADLVTQEVSFFFRRTIAAPESALLRLRRRWPTHLRGRVVVKPTAITLGLGVAWLIKAVVFHDPDIV